MIKYPLKTLIVEDRLDDLSLLKEYVKRFESLISVRIEARTYEAAKEALLNETEPFDLSFLDIELDNNTNCYELMHDIGLTQFGIITFSSKIQSGPFKYTARKGSFLYLSKPYNQEDIEVFIKSLKEEVEQRNQLQNNLTILPRLAIKENKTTRFLSQHDILYIEVNNTLCMIHYIERGELKKIPGNSGVSLTQYQEKLHHQLFHRLDEKFLININNLHSADSGCIFLTYDKNPQLLSLPLKENKKKNLFAKFLRVMRKE